MVSVCIATYNGELYLREQIDSILLQISETDEIIISDDNSRDKTYTILSSYHDKRLRLIRNDTARKGCIGNFENALRHVRGEYIFLSDQDDVWLPGKYVKICELLQDYTVVVHDSIVTDKNLFPVCPSFFHEFGSGKGIIKNIVRSSYYGSCMAFRREILNWALPFPATNEIGHDLWIGLIGELKGNVLFYPTPYLLYRRHESTTTSMGVKLEKGRRPLWKKCRGRIIMIRELIKFLFR